VDYTIDTHGPLDGHSIATSMHVSVLVSARRRIAAIRLPESVTDLVASEPNSQATRASHAKTRDGNVS